MVKTRQPDQLVVNGVVNSFSGEVRHPNDDPDHANPNSGETNHRISNWSWNEDSKLKVIIDTLQQAVFDSMS